MLVALLAVLGVDLIVIVVLLTLVISRKRWVRRQPAAFPGRIRTVEGQFDGVGAKWRRGYGRWVRDVLVWNKAPLLFRNEFVPVDVLSSERSGAPDELKRLGDDPVVVELRSGEATIEVAASGENRDRLRGPYAQPATSAPPS
jgi:Protein of unknown function (DUF2550)